MVDRAVPPIPSKRGGIGPHLHPWCLFEHGSRMRPVREAHGVTPSFLVCPTVEGRYALAALVSVSQVRIIRFPQRLMDFTLLSHLLPISRKPNRFQPEEALSFSHLLICSIKLYRSPRRCRGSTAHLTEERGLYCSTMSLVAKRATEAEKH